MIKIGGVVYRNIQEQVAKNTQDIAKIQRKPVLQVKKVDELPEEGEEGILYLLPASDPEIGNYFEEYLWIDSAWELIGSSAVDISNMVTTDTEQTITGQKTFNGSLLKFSNENNANYFTFGQGSDYYWQINWNGATAFYGTNDSVMTRAVRPMGDNAYDLGSSSYHYKDLYLSGQVIFGNSTNFVQFSSGTGKLYSNIGILVNGDVQLQNGNITDGTNSVSVADLAALITYAKAQGWIS